MRRPLRNDRGFGLLEAVITMALAGVILAGVAALLVQQQRFYTLTGEASAAESRLQPMKTALAPELMPTNPGDADLVYMDEDSLATRVYRGVFAVCAKALTTDIKLTVRQLSANSALSLIDSALVYSEGPTGSPDDDRWVPVNVVSVGTGSCPDGSSAASITVPNLASLNTRTAIGAPVRLFDHGSYWLQPRSDGWVLVTNAYGNSARAITEPLAPVDLSKPKPLQFSYLDAAGNATTTLTEIRSIEITATTSGGAASWRTGDPYVAERTVLLKLRNTE